jgi:hypothetical protein
VIPLEGNQARRSNDKETITVVSRYKIKQGKVVRSEQAQNSLAWRASIWNNVLG